MLSQRSRTPRTRKKGATPTKQGQRSGDSQNSGNGVQSGVNGGVAALAQTVKKNVLEFFTPSKDASLPAIVESSESGFEEGILFGDTVPTSSPSSEQFVCARKFFQERETRERLASDYSSTGDTPSQVRESTRRLSIRKPFNQYIAYSSDEELEDWRQQPKSDYTYSESLTYRERVTPDRKIGSPNMSRRGLRGMGMKYIQSKDFSSSDLSTDDTNHLELRTRSILKPMDALSDTSDGEEVVEDPTPVMRRLRSSRSRSVDVAPHANGSSITRTHTTTTYTTTKTLHRGLDVESDVEDSSESSVPLRATPLIARSGTPLGRAATPLGRAATPLGRAATPIGRAATPIGRAATPIGRATTPVNSAVHSSLLDTARGGYTLAKGAIAEDVEEVEDDTPKNCMVAWSRRTWQRVTWISTVITTSVVMMVARAVTSRRHDSANAAQVDGAYGETGKKSRSSSFMSTVTLTTRRVTTSTSEFIASTKERLRKNPLLLWIPLLFLLLLLGLVAYWWLLQSRAKTDDDTATDLTDGPSFLSLVVNSTSELTHLVINGVSQATHSAALGMTSWLLTAWSSVLGAASWLVAALLSCLHTAWVFLASMFSWLGSMVHESLSYLLHFLYLAIDFLQYLVFAVLGFISSSVSYVYGLFLPIVANTTNETTTTQEAVFNTWEVTETVHEKQSETWNISGWVSNAASLKWASDIYTSLSEGAKATQNWAWSGWMWLVLSVADALTTAASFLLWLLGSLWSLVCNLVSGLWTILAYIITGTVSFLASAATTVTSLAVETSSAVAHYSKLMFLLFFKPSENSEKVSRTVVTPPSQETEYLHMHSASMEEVVRRVLSSGELKTLIATVAAESSSKGQLTKDDIANLVRSVVEGEIGIFKKEVSNLNADMKAETKLASEDANMHIKSLKMQQEYLLQQLDQLSVSLTKVEGSVEVGNTIIADHHTEYEKQLMVLRGQIEDLTTQLKDLENNQSTLAGKIKQCCHNVSVTLADVERHVAVLLGDVFGIARDNADGGAGVKTEDIAVWLRSYFVAKNELEARLSTLMTNLQANTVSDEKNKVTSQAAMAQTTQIVMDAVLEELRGEFQKQQVLIAEQTQQQIAQQVQQQVEAAASVLGEQVSKQLKVQLDSSKQHLEDTVLAAVDENVPSHIAAALPAAVATAVSDTVAAKVPMAVETALASAVNIAMEGSVDKAIKEKVIVAVSEAVAGAVPEAVNVAVTNIVAKAVPQAVAIAVPEMVEAGLPESVIIAMQKAVAAEVDRSVAMAVPEAVASFLPAAVNDSVASAVSAAFVQANVNKAGDRVMKVNANGEEGVVVLAGSSSSTVSATVNISKNSTTSTNGASFFGLGAGLNESAVIQIVKEALMKYDADKTGMVDHALESAGGNIISTRCTESYQVHQAEVSILGFPIYRYSTNNPRTIIQPDRMPGQCWAFKGSQGYIVVQLAGPVQPTGFTLEHIPRSLSPTGEIDSAPREFEVWGLHSENDEGVLLGTYEYSQNGDPLQYFAVQKNNQEFFPLIELKINSNHGNLQYTCLYRFRVHGKRFL